MRYLFDSSAIFSVLELNSSDKLFREYTLDLARYELGNIVWKEGVLRKRISGNEQERVIETIVEVLDGMSILKIDGHEKNIIKLAAKLRLSFYDASYAYFANVMDVPLVSVDKSLVNKAKGHIKIVELESI